MNVRDSRVHNYPPRWNGAPSQELLVIRRNHQTGEVSLDPLRWGLIPYWCQDPKGGRKPINAKGESVHSLPTFREAYRRRRCILPVDGFFEWKAIKGQKAKQPYAIAMKDGRPFGIGGLWENWKDPTSGEWMRTFAIITTDANELVAEIHDRMPLILAPTDYTRWLSDEPDPGDLMRPFPAEPMRMWPISTRVNKPENDDPSIVEPIAIATSAAQLYRSYVFGVVRVATLNLLTLTALSACLSCGVVTAKVSGHAVTLRSSPTVLADTSMSGSTSTRILSGKLPSAS
jgi:putative SOS response-associated peptidase YedK